MINNLADTTSLYLLWSISSLFIILSAPIWTLRTLNSIQMRIKSFPDGAKTIISWIKEGLKDC